MKKLIYIPIILIFVLTLVQVFVSNSLSTTGVTLANIQDKIATYQKENELLKEKLLTQSSLTTIASSAAQLGFAPEKVSLDLSTSLPLAVKP